jgi:hypothetical protein
MQHLLPDRDGAIVQFPGRAVRAVVALLDAWAFGRHAAIAILPMRAGPQPARLRLVYTFPEALTQWTPMEDSHSCMSRIDTNGHC